MPRMPNKFLVVRDTREKQNFGFNFLEDEKYCRGTIDRKLETGDYSIDGFEEHLCIERKRNTGELAGNIVEARFDRELERMLTYKYRFLVCEFPYSDILRFPDRSGIPKYKWQNLRVTGKFLLRRVVEIQMMGINVVFFDTSADCKSFVWYTTKRVYEELTKNG